ncbi:MAG: hypothetical protein FWH08_01870 [Oscillospiraceae bacterium]|nr:hypothetical protein [Oscillospiraceae bacterium]
MFICDILAALCSGAALTFTVINFKFIARLPAMISDTSLPASDRNVKLIIFITMLVIIGIFAVKFFTSVGKILYRQLVFKKLPEGGGSGFLANMFDKSGTKPYRIFTVMMNLTAVLYVGVMLLLVSPNQSYVVGAGRAGRVVNENLHALWEIDWFLPMLGFLLVMLAIGLVIDITRLKAVYVIHEYEEIYAFGKERVIKTQKCGSCGFENHPTSRLCADCGKALSGLTGKRAMTAKT